MIGSALIDCSKSIVLIGLMGAGKTSIGRRLAGRIAFPFTDADDEIVKAAGMSIENIFESYGEEAFRDVEQRVIARLLESGRHVLATGGGAFMNPDTRDQIRDKGISVWLRADIEILVERTSRRGGRPLLKDKDPRTTLTDLMDKRYPVYAEADIVVDTSTGPPETTVDRVFSLLTEFVEQKPGSGELRQ